MTRGIFDKMFVTYISRLTINSGHPQATTDHISLEHIYLRTLRALHHLDGVGPILVICDLQTVELVQVSSVFDHDENKHSPLASVEEILHSLRWILASCRIR